MKGKCHVDLFWKKDNSDLSYNRNFALKRLQNLEKKFSKDQILAKKYSETINSYITKSYVIKIKSTKGSQCNNITNYNTKQINSELFLMPEPNIKVTV